MTDRQRLGPSLAVSQSSLNGQGSNLWGSVSAENQLIIFIDYECQPCKQMLQQLESFKTSSFSLSIFHFPLTKAHPLASKAALVALASTRSDNFRKIHRILVEPYLSNSKLDELIRTYSLDLKQAESLLEQNLKIASQLGVHHTPSLFLKRNNEIYELSNIETLFDL